MQAKDRYVREGLEFSRAVTFFDAIFAFSLTLLVTTLNDFSPEAWASLSTLRSADGGSFFSFVLSFCVVVRFWRGSHQTIASLVEMDGLVVTLSLFMLFGVVTLPFTTEALGKAGLRELPLPVAIYAVNVAYTFVMQRAVTLMADRRGLSATRMSRARFRGQVWTSVPLPAVFLGSIPLAYLFGATTAEISWASLVVLIPLTSALVKRAGLGD